VPFNDINVFAVNHILFPAQNINTLQAAYAPGDLVIFGDIAPALTSLVVEPLTTTSLSAAACSSRPMPPGP
jgi:hypothetical protein